MKEQAKPMEERAKRMEPWSTRLPQQVLEIYEERARLLGRERNDYMRQRLINDAFDTKHTELSAGLKEIARTLKEMRAEMKSDLATAVANLLVTASDGKVSQAEAMTWAGKVILKL